MINEPIIVDNFLHIINQRKIVNLFESSEIHWTLAMFPSYGNRLAYPVVDKSDKQVWEDSPTLRHLLYIKDKETAISEQEKYVINLFQQGIEKQIHLPRIIKLFSKNLKKLLSMKKNQSMLRP